MFTNTDAKEAGRTLDAEWQEAMKNLRTGGLDKHTYWAALLYKRISSLEQEMQSANTTITQLESDLQKAQEELAHEKEVNIKNSRFIPSFQEFMKRNSGK